MLEIYDQVAAACDTIRQHTSEIPRVGIILGTGLGGLAAEIEVEATLPYSQIPNFLTSTATGHAGRLVIGKLSGVPVMAMEGRFHYYEGYPLKSITLPVRVFKAMGAELMIVSNACGGLNPQFRNGDIMVIDDQINLIGDNPLIGINDDRLGPRFPDMSEPYDRAWIESTLQIARQQGIYPHRGVFVAVAGPCLETKAEYRFLRQIGADVVGMSTVPETIVAVHAGLKTVGLSVITDMCLPDNLHAANVQDIIATATAAQPKLIAIVRGIVEQVGNS